MSAKLIVANWKMVPPLAEGQRLAQALVQLKQSSPLNGVEIALCPPFTHLATVKNAVNDQLPIGGQDCHAETKGAYTGDISAAFLQEIGCRYVILGHSERRMHHGEANATVAAKAAAAHRHGLTAIICVGETLAEREGGKANDVVGRQIAESLPEGVSASNVVVAYEPVWAIGTGKTATVEQIAEMHGFIRTTLQQKYPAFGGSIKILYGGSVKADNAKQILSTPAVDGALVGSASLDPQGFWAIASAA